MWKMVLKFVFQTYLHKTCGIYDVLSHIKDTISTLRSLFFFIIIYKEYK